MDLMLKPGTVLFHGTIEEFPEREIRGGGYDDVIWAADNPAVAQNYIPVAGIESMVGSDDVARPNKSPVVQEIQQRLGIHFDYSPEGVTWDYMDRAVSYAIPENGMPDRDAVKQMMLDAGFVKSEYGHDVFRIKSTYVDDPDDPDKSIERIIMPGKKLTGRLFIFTAEQPLRIFDMTDSDGDLMNPDYHNIPAFRAAEKAGYDGIKINDFAQSELWGNVGHTSIGLFAGSMHKLGWDVIPATNFDWKDDLSETTTPEYAAYLDPGAKRNPAQPLTPNVGIFVGGEIGRRAIILLDLEAVKAGQIQHDYDTALDDAVLGFLYMGWEELELAPEDAYVAQKAVAQHGWGPLLYGIAMSVAASDGTQGLIPDRRELSKDAQAVWKKFYQREDIAREPLNEGRMWGQPHLDQIYSSKLRISRNVRATRSLLRRLFGRLDEAETILWEHGESWFQANFAGGDWAPTRNPIATGDCYRWAYNYLVEREKWKPDVDIDDTKMLLVHGTVHPDFSERRYEHAWLEIRGKRIKDWQHHSGEGPAGLTGGRPQKLSLSKKKFYQGMKPQDIRKYTLREALIAIAKEHKSSGKLHFGPWDYNENPSRKPPTQGVYYHATFRAYLDDILENGLGNTSNKNYPGSTSDVCLARFGWDAHQYAEDALEAGVVSDDVYDSGIVLLEVDMAGLEHLMRLDPNIDDEDPDAYVYPGIIPPERISRA